MSQANTGSYLLPNFSPFQSSGGLCYPSTDYRNAVVAPGSTVVSQPATGGAKRGRSTKRSSSKSRSKSPKRGRSRTMRGGADVDFGTGKNYTPSNYSNSGLIPISTGQDLFKAPEYEKQFDQKFIDENMGKSFTTSFGGAKKKTTKKTSKKSKSKSRSRSRSRSSSKSRKIKKTVKRRKHRGGENNIKNFEGLVISFNYYPDIQSNKTLSMKGRVTKVLDKGLILNDMYFIPYSTNATINNSVYKTLIINPNSVKVVENMYISNAEGGAKKKRTKSKSKSRSRSRSRSSSRTKKSKKTKKSTKRRVMRGGEESWGQTYNPPQFNNASAPIPDFAANSGKGAMSAYGTVSPNDIGVGMLAPYNTNPAGNQASMQKTGGAKKKRTKSKSRSRSRSRSSSRSKKTKKSTKRRVMRGGEESWGQTYNPPQFYNASAPIPDFAADSGKGMMTAYGNANPRDVGIGMLAPYNANPAGNQASMQKTGGAKKRRSKSKSKKTKKSMKKTKKSKKSKKSRSKSRKH